MSSASALGAGDRIELSAPGERLANVERLRILAMVEIVAFHAAGRRLPVLDGLGLPLFLLLTNVFNCSLTDRWGLKRLLRAKCDRLILPWVVWSIIYAGLLAEQALRTGTSLAEVYSWSMLLAGTYFHLWFLPFAMLSSLIVGCARVASRPLSSGLAIAIAIAAAAAAALVPGAIVGQVSTWPASQWLFSFPSAFLGFAIGCAFLSGSPAVVRRSIAILVVGCAALWSLSGGIEAGYGYRYGISIALISAALAWPGRSDRVTEAISPLLLGIYLVHPLIIRVIDSVHPLRLGIVGDTALIFALSAGFVAGLRRSRLGFAV